MKTQLIFDQEGRLVVAHQFGWITDTTLVSKLRHKMREVIVDSNAVSILAANPIFTNKLTSKNY